MLSFPGVKVVSFIPGRVRLRVEKMKGNQDFAERVEKELSENSALKLVETKADSGSVLIKYDRKLLKQEHHADELLKSLRRLFPGFDTEKLRKYLV
jgi:hypothetical protein